MATSKRIQAADRIVFLYRLKDGRYSEPDVQPATGETPVPTLLGCMDGTPVTHVSGPYNQEPGRLPSL